MTNPKPRGSRARGKRGLMKMADNHIRLESSPGPDPLSQADLRTKMNGGRRRRPQSGRRDRRCWRMGSSFEHPSSRALQFLSSLPLLSFLSYISTPAFLLSIYPYTLSPLLSTLEGFPNSILNLNHDSTATAVFVTPTAPSRVLWVGVQSL